MKSTQEITQEVRELGQWIPALRQQVGHVVVGQKYLVFAGIRDGKLFTGNCSRTKKLEYAQGDLQELGESKGQKKKQE